MCEIGNKVETHLSSCGHSEQADQRSELLQ